MEKFWIDFSGYACIEAGNTYEAKEKLWYAISHALAFPADFSDYALDINGIIDEEKCESIYGNYLGNEKVTAVCMGHTPTSEEWENFWNEK